MGLILISLQDEEDGSVTLGFTAEPTMKDDEEPMLASQIFGMIALQAIVEEMRSMQDEQEPQSSIEG